MFELGKIGVPLLIVGTIYTLFFAPRLLPRRDTLTTLLSPQDRKPQLVQILIRRDSPLKGKALSEVPWLFDPKIAGIRILEARRRGNRLMDELKSIRLEELDRLTISVSAEALLREAGELRLMVEGKTEKELGFETLTPVEGRIVEAIVAPQSKWEGKTIKQIRLRQKYGLLVLAVHRNGKNISADFANLSLSSGDTLLLLGSSPAVEDASDNDDNLILLEEHTEPEVTAVTAPWMGWMAAVLVALVVLVSAFEWVSISVASIAACCLLMLFRVIEPKEAYRSIDWPILMIICGTMSLGMALEQTGTATWIASHSVEFLQQSFSRENLPWLMLVFFVILTSVFTEFASNNGAAALMVPLALETSKHLGVSPMPFLVAVTISASAAFATPIGYQTNTMVYGAGGYNFRDFLRMGSPLNLICWVTQIVLIPMIWKF
jgi:di/tricarboxylate transporter